jgi:hypothetical protein
MAKLSAWRQKIRDFLGFPGGDMPWREIPASERFAGLNNLMIFFVTVMLTASWCFAFVWQFFWLKSSPLIVDTNTFKDVLLVVLSASVTAKAVAAATAASPTNGHARPPAAPAGPAAPAAPAPAPPPPPAAPRP